jgi:hypothetical protein
VVSPAIALISDGLEDGFQEAAIVIAVIAGYLGLYTTLRKLAPPWAAVLAFPFKAVWSIVRFVFLAPRWVWRQLWRDSKGVTRGPWTRATARVTAWLTGLIEAVVGPMIQGVRETAKAQHDEQNDKIDAVATTVTEGLDRVAERLDRGSEIMAEHARSIAKFEDHIKNRPHNQRSTDPKDGPT